MTTTMKAVAYRQQLPTSEEFLSDMVLDRPAAPTGYDILVEVKAISVNPVDTKVRMRVDPAGTPKVLGFDAAGVVVATGDQVNDFKVGDEVYYAGSLTRPGTNSEFHLVDARIVGHKPKTLDFAAAAALPLTTITAYEAIFDRLGIALKENDSEASKNKALLIVGGAGGVGSIAIQLARQLTDLTIIATASRPETQEWCQKMGAHHVVDHRGDMVAQIAEINKEYGDSPLQIAEIFSTNATDQHWAALAEIIAPQGKICLIDDPENLDLRAMKQKSISVHWEFMFTRPVFGTDDISAQHDLLEKTAQLVDAGKIQTTANHDVKPINAENLRAAHIALETNSVYGKIVLAGFE